MNLRRIGEDNGGVGNIFGKFHEYLEGIVLRSMMPDFKKYVRKGGSRRDCWWILGELEGLLEESFRITLASLPDLSVVLYVAQFSSRSF